jgi:hypothetical protein
MTRSMIRKPWAGVALAALLAIVSCSGDSSNNGDDEVDVSPVTVPAASSTYIVLAWNDLGMHCLNPTYDNAVILPPYNNIRVQVIRRGNPPQVVTSGLTAKYRILNNTYSYGKRSYGQFWDNSMTLFGASLAVNTGLNLDDPNVHNGLAGTMLAKGDHFLASGIPVTPVEDSGAWNPFQVAEIIVSNATSGAEVGRTQATVPTSDEINCARCHGGNALFDVLKEHDDEEGTSLVDNRPVLCAGCHGSPALGQTGPGSSGHFLSDVIHSSHADRGASCYDCHPGPTTKCMRSTAHTSADGNCIACHGNMEQVGSSVHSGARLPWLNEPKCSACHAGIAQVDTGSALYRNAEGHGGLGCPACHQSPHAMVPTSQASDNYQAIQLQNRAKALGSCGVCHPDSRGEGMEEFGEAHGGSRVTACAVCHTAAPKTNTAQWPHQFQWKSRT